MEEEEEEILFSPCLLCSSPGSPLPVEPLLPADGSKRGEDEEEDYCPRLNSHLWSVFVLRKLLAVPAAVVEQWLRELGGGGGVHPGDWYYLCDLCCSLAKQTLELHTQIVELQNKIKRQREEAYDTLRASILSEGFDRAEEERERSGVVVVCARDTVRKYFRDHFGGHPEEQSPIVPLSPFVAVKLESGDEGEDAVVMNVDKEEFLHIPEHENNEKWEAYPRLAPTGCDSLVDNLETSCSFLDEDPLWEEGRGPQHDEVKTTGASVLLSRARKRRVVQQTNLNIISSPPPSECSEMSGDEEEEEDLEKDPVYIPKDEKSSRSKRKLGRVNHKRRGTVVGAGASVPKAKKKGKDTPPERRIGRYKRVMATPETGTLCPICKRWFSPTSFAAHLKKHEQREALRCKLCGFKARYPKELKDHSTNHDEQPNFHFFSCDQCDYKCSNVASKSLHLQNHKIDANIETTSSTTSGELSCKLCSARFQNLFKIKLHLRQAHGAELGLKTFQCPQCPKSCTSNQLLKLHISSKHQRTFKHYCEHCGYGCDGPAHLRNHMAALHSGGKKEFICDICGKECSTFKALRIHKLTSHDDGAGEKKKKPRGKEVDHQEEEQRRENNNQQSRAAAACKSCEYVAGSKTMLVKHRKKEHPELFELQCSKCPQRFMKLHTLLRHEQLYHPQES